MDTIHILQVNHIAKAFGRRQVLNDISFQVEKGKILAIMGENGAGKSTLLKILVGLLRPDSGNIELRSSLGYCPQELMIFERLTVWENPVFYADAQNKIIIHYLPAFCPSQVSMIAAVTDYFILKPLAGSLLYGPLFLVAAHFLFWKKIRIYR
jgi:ABC-type transporter Mla maintaining outer membrane lipid asymmetry ATPase subunit MlaF